jgi:hypothetical protein
MIYNLPRVDFREKGDLTVEDLAVVSSESTSCFALGREIFRRHKSLSYAENYARKHDRDPAELIRGYEWQERVMRIRKNKLRAAHKARQERLRLEKLRLIAEHEKQEEDRLKRNLEEFREFLRPLALSLESNLETSGGFWTDGPDHITYHIRVGLSWRTKQPWMLGPKGDHDFARISDIFLRRERMADSPPRLKLRVAYAYFSMDSMPEKVFYGLTLDQARRKLENMMLLKKVEE